MEAGISAEEVAIKTADVNELKEINLLDRACRIRYIITVNALKEGWDCPFAYILATLANRTSQVDVEQILGRILRQPHTRRMRNTALNMSYVLTSSRDFKETLDGIVRGLNSAGFSERDCRAVSEEKTAPNYKNILVVKSLGHGAGSIDFSQKVSEISDEDWQEIVSSGDEYAKNKLEKLDRLYEIEIFPEHAIKLLQSLENSAFGEFLKDLDEGYLTLRKVFR